MTTAPTSRRILLLRHAKSSWGDRALADFDRPLAPRGRRAAGVVGAYLRDEGLVPDRVLCSSARRAADTWTLVAEAAGLDGPVDYQDDIYGAPPDQLIEILRGLDHSVSTVALIGHHPGIDGCALALAGGREGEDARRMAAKFPTAALAVIDVDIGRWRELGEGRGRLDRFVTPKELAGRR